MRKSSPAGLVVPVLVLALGAWGCSDGGGGGTAGTGGGAAGRGGTGGGAAGTGGSTGGATAGTGGSAAGTGGATGGSTAGTGGSTAGTGGAAGRGGTGGGTAGTGGATGGSTAGTGGATGGSTAGTGGATGGSTAGTGGATAGTGGGTAGTGGGTGGTPSFPQPGADRHGDAAAADGGHRLHDPQVLREGRHRSPAWCTDNWDPTAGVGDVATFTATYTVAATGGTHTTVQAALNAAVTAGGTTRVYIKVEPGTYRETVCLKASPTPPPITLYSTNADASMTTIVNNANAGKLYVDATTQPPWNPCAASAAPAVDATYGTSGSAAVAFYARDFQAKNLTFANDYAEAGTSNIQAVALMTQNDKQIYENVRVLGNQDSLYVKTGNVDTVQRVYFKNCYVEGDTDFIFGRATFVLDNCEIKYLGARRGATSGGYVVSPSTDVRNAYGLLIINSMFTSDGVPNAGTVFLGRAWDEGQQTATYPTPTAAGGLPERPGRDQGLDAGRPHHRGRTVGQRLDHRPRVQLGRGRGDPRQPPVGVPEHRRRRRAVKVPFSPG